MRSPTFYKGKEQTYVKHFFLENYLQTVAFHIGYNHPEFVYVDGFSGPWRVHGENISDTSFWIALDRLNYVLRGLRAQHRKPLISAIFVEKEREAFSSLQNAVEKCKGSVEVTPLSGRFEQQIPQILRQTGPAFTFFFIDPRGWTGFSMEAIRPVLSHTPGEVVINFMYDYINRFLNSTKPSTEKSLDMLFGTTRWRSLRAAEDRERAIVDFYAEQVRAAGHFRFVTSTRILKPTHNRAYYHLVYATRNPKGIIKFRSVEKRAFAEQEQVRWVAKRDAREERTGQTEFKLEPTKPPASELDTERAQQIQRAEELMLRLLRNGPLADDVIRPQVLELPLVWESDFNSIARRLQDRGKLHIDGLRPRERGPKSGCTLRLP